MPLPKIQQPLFEITIPSTKKKIKIRPFTVKEEKILLIGRESGDVSQIFLSIEQVITNCIQDDIDVSELATFDLEYILMHIRGKAVNDTVEFEVNDPEIEGRKISLSFDVNKVEIARLGDFDPKIAVSDDWTITMRYPTLKELHTMVDSKEGEGSFNVMISCINEVMSSDGEQIFRMKDFSKEEVDSFIDDLSGSALEKIQTFFTSMPAMRIECPYQTPTGEDKKFVIEGIESFFM
jgi:hypothetical protein